jgi:hypothetical protein
MIGDQLEFRGSETVPLMHDAPLLLDLFSQSNGLAEDTLILAFPGVGIRWYLQMWNQTYSDPMIHLDHYGEWKDRMNYNSWILRKNEFDRCLWHYKGVGRRPDQREVWLIGYMNNWREIVDHAVQKRDMGVGTLIVLETRYIENVIKYRQSREYQVNDLPIVKVDYDIEEYVQFYKRFLQALVDHLNKITDFHVSLEITDLGQTGKLLYKVWRKHND